MCQVICKNDKCKKEFYPYFRRLFCSEDCFREYKVEYNKAAWKKKKKQQIKDGKKCSRCKQYYHEENMREYCPSCKKILKEKKTMDKNCKDCHAFMPDVQHNKLYCDDCKEIRNEANLRRNLAKDKEKALKVKSNNKARGKKKPINTKWLNRGL